MSKVSNPRANRKTPFLFVGIPRQTV
ncbi:hypothetical protein Atc_0118 [Acidithiobacillus caldus SM-1]|uniref:Uncharacterized protein n=1 Tax=Acidithiobacillus caldus (strain SM-1) TaxID=990288 RepID=F9ZPB3_ACICS|nr:hypothetical protein Atc_0118 [Acidithiobacillus caldus SM-1]